MNQLQLLRILEKKDLTPNQWALLCYLESRLLPRHLQVASEIAHLRTKGYVDEHNKLTPKGLQVVLETDPLFKKGKVKAGGLDEHFMEQVEFYRSMFPEGVHPQMRYRYRSTVSVLAQKFAWFFQQYPAYSWETVLDATSYYIQEQALNRHLHTSTDSNFIRKTDQLSRLETSKLAQYCELLVSGELQGSAPAAFDPYTVTNTTT